MDARSGTFGSEKDGQPGILIGLGRHAYARDGRAERIEEKMGTAE